MHIRSYQSCSLQDNITLKVEGIHSSISRLKIMMLRLLVISVLVYGALSSPYVEPKTCRVLGCYHYNGAQSYAGKGKFYPKDIDASLCTHLFYAFANIKDGKLAASESTDEAGMYKQFTDLKKKNTQLKTLLSVGGDGASDKNFKDVVADASTRKKFNDDAITYLREWEFDGLDLDWEYPTDKTLFTKWVKELRATFDAEKADPKYPKRERLLLTAAVAVGKPQIDNSYEIDEIFKHLDWINLMSYDFHGYWKENKGDKTTGHHTAVCPFHDEDIYTVKWASNYWLCQRKTLASKLVLGMASYGRTYTRCGDTTKDGVNVCASGMGSNGTYTKEAGLWSYYEICEKLEKEDIKSHTEKQIVYANSPTAWVGYDDVNSLDGKKAIIQELGLRGGMVWALEYDDFKGTFCGKKTGKEDDKWPLIKKMKKMVLGDDYTPDKCVSLLPIPTTSKSKVVCDETLLPKLRPCQEPVVKP